MNQSLIVNNIFFLYLLWFFIIFGPVLDSPVGQFGDISFLVAGTLALRCFYIKLSPIYIYSLLLLCVICVFALSTAIISDWDVIDVAVRAVLRPIKAAIFLLGVISLTELTIKYYVRLNNANSREVFYKVIEIIFYCIVLHALIMVLQFLVPSFKHFIYSLTMAKYQLEHYQFFRMAGLSGGGGAQVSVVQSLGFLLGFSLLRQSRNHFIIILSQLLIMMSIFLSGRSGFLTVVLVVFFYFALSLLFLIYSSRIVLRFSRLALYSCLFGTFMVVVTYLLQTNEYFMVAFERTFDTFINYKESGKVSDNTLSALGEMFILPTEFTHLLFGRASFLENNTFYDIDTDIGYFRLIWGYGFFGLLLHILVYFLLSIVAFKVYFYDRGAAYLCFMVLVLIFFFNAKEIFFFTKMSFQITLSVLCAAGYAFLSAKNRSL